MQKHPAIASTFVVARVWPAVVTLLLLSAVAAARAQVCMNVNLNDPPAETISPMYWAPGQTYNVTLTDPNAEFYSLAPPPATSLFIFDQSQYTGPNEPVYLEDPYVTHSAPTYLSPTQTSFTVTVAAGAPIENDGLNFTCLQTGFVGAPGFIEITPCATPVTPGPLTPASIQPDTWIAGKQTSITINGSGFIPTNNPNGCEATTLSITAGAENVSILSMTVVSSTEIVATVQPLATDPAETATVTVSNYLYNGNGQTPPSNWASSSTTAQIWPSACPVPHVASASPNVWFAGATYSGVAFTGTNFITQANATPTCPATTVNALTASGVLTLSNINVTSATQITATVVPGQTEPTEGATIAAVGDPNPAANADVLGAPIIKWNGDQVSLPDNPPPAVIGQTISLITEPTIGTLAGLPIPLTFSIQGGNQWMVGGTNIGGYTVVPPSSSSPTVSSARVANTVLTRPELTTYWLVPSSGTIPVTYQYCVTPTIGGQICSNLAMANFSVSGPTGVGVSTWNKTFGAVYLPPETLQWNILFEASATSPPSNPGEYQWVQIVTSAADLEYFGNGTKETCSGGPALDTSYPYGTGLRAGDAPTDEIGKPDESGVSDALNFQTYLMWNPQTDSTSIPVSLGSISWSANGAISFNSVTHTWGEETGKTTAASFAPSSTEPQWGAAITGASLEASCKLTQ